MLNKDYINKNMCHGFDEYDMASWDEFIEFIGATILDYSHYICRGQANLIGS